jgi:hypothetical protein
MSSDDLQGYALFADGSFLTILYYPSGGSWQAIKITAALKSNPTISLNTFSNIKSVNTYQIFVDGEYVDSIVIPKETEMFDMRTLHHALQSNPTVVWIDSETRPNPNSKWSYENNVLTQVAD